MSIQKLPKSEWKNCPYCENTGTYVTYRTMVTPMNTVQNDNQPVGTPEPQPNYHRCHWCHNHPESVYNQKRVREAEK